MAEEGVSRAWSPDADAYLAHLMDALSRALALPGGLAERLVTPSEWVLWALVLLAPGAALWASRGALRRRLARAPAPPAAARSMPDVTTLYLIGACSISGVPLFNGFVSKPLIVSAASDHGLTGVEWLLTIASVGTFLHTGLKLPYFTFFGPDRGLAPVRLPSNMIAAMSLAAVACIGIGIVPGWLYARLPLPPVDYLPYTAEGQARARALNKRLDLDRLIADLGACATTLRGRPECHGKVGGIGFCLGGKLAYLCAARLDVDAAVSYYGVKIEAFLDEADNVTCPLLLHFAGNDSHVPPDAVAAVRARLTDKSNVTIHVYTGAEHGFNRAGYPPYDAASAKLARVRSLDLLERALS